MIFYFILLATLPQFCEVIYTTYDANIIITKINVDLFTVKKDGFIGVNRKIHRQLCENLGNAPITPFEPLPIDREFFEIPENENFSPPHDPNSWQPEDIPSSSQSQNIASSSQSEDISSSSKCQYLKLIDFLAQSHPCKKKRGLVVDKVIFGENNDIVTTVSCKFNDFRIFLVPIELLAGYILLLDMGENTKHVPLGITLKRMHFTPAYDIEINDIPNRFSEMIMDLENGRAEKKVPVLFRPMEPISNMTEMKKLKNFQLCSSIYTFVNFMFYDDEKILTSTMTYKVTPGIDSLMCHVSMLYTYQIFEHPTEKYRIFLSRQILYHQYAINYYTVWSPGIGTINL